MIKPKPTPVQNRALRFLHETIDTYRLKNSWKLPPSKHLAAMAGVSQATMLKAIAVLRERGVIQVSHRYGIILPEEHKNDTGKCNSIALRHEKWEYVSGCIEADFIAKRPKIHRLPSCKALAKHYNVNERTIRKAINSLIARGELTRRGRTLQLPHSSRSQRSSIVLIARGNSQNDVLFVTLRTNGHLLALERECSQNGIDLSIVSCTVRGEPYEHSTVYNTIQKMKKKAIVLGIIFWSVGFHNDGIESIGKQLIQFSIPTAILDEHGFLDYSRFVKLNRRLRIFPLGFSSCAGKAVGHYLYASGHRKIAYISNEHERLWSANRYTGLLSIFGKENTYPVISFLSPEKSKMQRSDVSNESECIAEKMRSSLQKQNSPDTTVRGETTLANHFLYEGIKDIIEQKWLYQNMYKVLEKALGNDRCTAWVAINDPMALVCFYFLLEHGIRVPRDIAVIGFDDSRDAAFNGLSSYNFNGTGVIRKIITWFLNGTSSTTNTHPYEPEIKGFVTVRNSTRYTVGRL